MTEQTEKRRPGRPRIHPLTPKVKRPRGRPRKSSYIPTLEPSPSVGLLPVASKLLTPSDTCHLDPTCAPSNGHTLPEEVNGVDHAVTGNEYNMTQVTTKEMAECIDTDVSASS